MKCANLVLLWAIFSVQLAFSQPGSLDETFVPGQIGFGFSEGANNTIRTISLQKDGKIIISGNFTSFNGVARNRLARLFENGSIDHTFRPGTGANNIITAAACLPNGKIFIGGSFTLYNGASALRFARINPDGSLDSSFTTSGANSTIYSISLQKDGKIIIAGDFTSYNGKAINRIARLNPDGSLDTTFNVGTAANGTVFTTLVQDDGKIFIAGSFSAYNGIQQKYVARLNHDGSVDSTFNTGSGAGGAVASAVLQKDGKILIGGFFTTFDGKPAQYAARLNSDGALDTTFSSKANNVVQAITLSPDEKIFIGGFFTAYDSIPCQRIACLNSDGTFNLNFNSGAGAENTVFAIIPHVNDKVIFAGDFNSISGTSVQKIARLESNGSLDPTFNPAEGANATVRATLIQHDSKILIAGDFTTYNGAAKNHIARLLLNGTLDQSFVIGSGANNTIYTIEKIDSAKIIIGGSFTTFNGKNSNRIIQLNSEGSIDSTFNIGSGANAAIHSISIQADGKIVIAGNFTSFNGISRNRVARLNSDGSLDLTFEPDLGANGIINDLAIQPDGKIIAGGNFTTYNNITAKNLARLNVNGSLDGNFNCGAGPDGAVYSITLQVDEKIIVAGDFSNINNVAKNKIAKLEKDGSIDHTFNIGSGADDAIFTTSLQDDGKILIGGAFTSYNNISKSNIARLHADGILDATFDMGNGPDNTVLTSAIQHDGKILIGGNFNSCNSIGRRRIARLQNNDLEIEILPFSKISFCEGENFQIDFTVKNGSFNAANIFTALLSDETGSFSSSKIIAATSATNSGRISAVFSNIPTGIYKIKIISSDPPRESNISSEITLLKNADAGIIIGDSVFCPKGTGVFLSNGDTGGTWSTADTTIAVINTLTGELNATGIGLTEIIYTLNTGCNSPTSALKQVIVSDEELPAITCPFDVEMQLEAGEFFIKSPYLGNAIVSDNCEIVEVINDAPENFRTGVSTVKWTAFDAAGNSATCIQNVTLAQLTSTKISAQNGSKEILEQLPNPVNSGEVIHFVSPVSENVKLEVFSSSAQKTAELLNKTLIKDQQYSIEIPAEEFPEGIFFYRITTSEGYIFGRKFLMLR